MKPGDFVTPRKSRFTYHLSVSTLPGHVDGVQNFWVGNVYQREIGTVLALIKFDIRKHDQHSTTEEALVLFACGVVGWQASNFFEVVHETW